MYNIVPSILLFQGLNEFELLFEIIIEKNQTFFEEKTITVSTK